jgi:hypothetical protein
VGAFFIDCVDELLDGLGFELATPRAAERRDRPAADPTASDHKPAARHGRRVS